MKYLSFVVSAGVLISALFANSITAAEVDEATADLWLLAKYDVNGDHMISVSEVSHKREKMFGYMDSDADGIVSFDEYQALDVRKRQLLVQARFNKLDLDRDGRLSADEYRSYLGSFDRFDQNGDGKISAQEMERGETSVAATKVDPNNTLCLLWVCVRTSLD